MWFGTVSEHVVEMGPRNPNSSVPGAFIGENPILQYRVMKDVVQHVCVYVSRKKKATGEREQ